MSRTSDYCTKCSHKHWEDGPCTYTANQYEGLHQQYTEQKTARKRAESERDHYRALTQSNHPGVARQDRQLALDLIDMLTTLSSAGDPRTASDPDAIRTPNRTSRELRSNRWAKEARRLRSRVQNSINEASQKIEGTWNPPMVWRARCQNRACGFYKQDQTSTVGPVEHCAGCGVETLSMTQRAS